jgi:16S rRNA (guanine(966)-N(2))-methyltransferase RsmD
MSSLRITGGTLRGRRIRVPAGDLRPTSERARQAYFNIVADRIIDARFLDLFAGSGIFSFEAVSRGASAAVAIDKSRKSTAAISETARELALSIDAINGDAVSTLSRLGGEPFDLVYADPPYDYDEYEKLLAAIAPRITEASLVAIEHRRNSVIPSRADGEGSPTRRGSLAALGMTPTRTAQYGEVWITFFAAPSSLATTFAID